MDWYYAHDGRQIGPVAETEFPQLLRTGVIKPETLVWHAGMPEWQPYRTAEGVPPPVGDAHRFCSACGNSFPAQDLAFFGESAVCASCKPAWVQRLRQGMATTTPRTFVYAGFWIRALAVIIDGIILGIARLVLMFAFGISFMRPTPGLGIGLLGLNQLVSMAAGILYYCFFWTRYGATPGKMVLKLKVVTPEGALISMPQAIARYFAEILSGLILCIGFIMAGLDDEKRALHDRLVGTRVIRIE